MPLDPQARAFLEQLATAGSPPIEKMSVEEARRSFTDMAALQGEPEEVAKIEDWVIAGPPADIPVRIYRPADKGPLPVLVYFHGGGWVVGNIATYDALCRALTNRAGCAVMSVDYRLAPEHPFPAATVDAYRATLWACENAFSFGGDPDRIAVGGDSAGGNLAAVVAQIARDRGKPMLKFQLLVYPVTDAACDTPSYRENGRGYLLTRDAMIWFWNHYVPSNSDRSHPYASPLRASNLKGLPPALVITAEYDPLRDEGELYAFRLREAGIPVQLSRYDGMIHGFFAMGSFMDQGKMAIQEAAGALRAAFGL